MCVAVSTGDECPCGTAVFHITFFSGPNSVGSPVVSATPLPFGPRKRDHSLLDAACADASATHSPHETMAPIRMRRMMLILREKGEGRREKEGRRTEEGGGKRGRISSCRSLSPTPALAPK